MALLIPDKLEILFIPDIIGIKNKTKMYLTDKELEDIIGKEHVETLRGLSNKYKSDINSSPITRENIIYRLEKYIFYFNDSLGAGNFISNVLFSISTDFQAQISDSQISNFETKTGKPRQITTEREYPQRGANPTRGAAEQEYPTRGANPWGSNQARGAPDMGANPWGSTSSKTSAGMGSSPRVINININPNDLDSTNTLFIPDDIVKSRYLTFRDLICRLKLNFKDIHLLVEASSSNQGADDPPFTVYWAKTIKPPSDEILHKMKKYIKTLEFIGKTEAIRYLRGITMDILRNKYLKYKQKYMELKTVKIYN